MFQSGCGVIGMMAEQPFGHTSCLASRTALFNIAEQILLSPTRVFTTTCVTTCDAGVFKTLRLFDC